MAQSVEILALDFDSGHDPRAVGAWGLLSILSLSLSLSLSPSPPPPPPPPLLCLLSLSLK